MLELILGCMFSGKTSELQRKVKRSLSIKKKVLVVNHTSDNRYSKDETIVTHDGGVIKSKTIEAVQDLFKDYDLVAIDESQFFEDITLIKQHLHSTDFVVAALSSDYHMNSIGNTLDLIPCCDNVVYLQALCTECSQSQNVASFTQRFAPPTSSNIDVGGKEKYRPVCRSCFLKHSKD
jgi:thymidine kinase